MTHISDQLNEQRRKRVAGLIDFIKIVFKRGGKVKLEKLINATSYNYGVSRRMSQDMIIVALSQIKHKFEGKGKAKLICSK